RETDEELDLVALATVADMVPLIGENRSLVRRGLAVARRAQRPGLRALIAAGGACAARLDEVDIAFRLAPRINADGRLYAADAGERGPAELTRTDRVDAVVGGGGLGLDLAEELDRLAPFGMGNPGVRLLVPSARVGDVQPMGEGKHARFSLQSGDRRALGVCF